MALDIQQKTVARLRFLDDGSLSNPRMELYALLRAEEVVTPNAAWIITTSVGRKRASSTSYQRQVHKSPVFKQRLEALMSEKAELQAQGDWGELVWQTKQNYRRAVTRNDPGMMMRATELLYKILARNEKPAPKAEGEEAADEPGRGPGAPLAPTPMENREADQMRRRLAHL